MAFNFKYEDIKYNLFIEDTDENGFNVSVLPDDFFAMSHAQEAFDAISSGYYMSQGEFIKELSDRLDGDYKYVPIDNKSVAGRIY